MHLTLFVMHSSSSEIERVIDEEKKEFEGERECGVDNKGEGEEEGGLTDLPEELLALIGNRLFRSEPELQSFLDNVGFGDLKVILVNGVPRQVTPSDQQNGFTTHYLLYFSHKWAKNKWGCASTTHKIHLANGRAREPDLSYWGYPRCRFDEGTLVPKKDGSIPDVVIQFSWRNKKKYEEDAINNMMNQGLEEQGAIYL